MPPKTNYIPETILPNAEINLSEAVNLYTEYMNAASLAQNTIYCYTKDLETMQSNFGNINLNGIKMHQINQLIIKQKQSKTSNRELSNYSLNRIKSAYRSFFCWCYENDFTNHDYSKYLRLVKAAAEPTLAIKPQEIRRLISVISNSDDSLALRDKTLFLLYAYTGIRKSEALVLRIRDYDPLTNILLLPKTKQDSKRIQLLPSILSQVLDDYISCRFNSGLKKNEDPRGDYQCLFTGVNSERPLSARQVSVRFQKWKLLSGIREGLTIHSFRAAFATELYIKTKDPLLVSYALGHSSFETTKKYISAELFDLQNVYNNAFRQYQTY